MQHGSNNALFSNHNYKHKHNDHSNHNNRNNHNNHNSYNNRNNQNNYSINHPHKSPRSYYRDEHDFEESVHTA